MALTRHRNARTWENVTCNIKFRSICEFVAKYKNNLDLLYMSNYSFASYEERKEEMEWGAEEIGKASHEMAI